MPGNHDKKGNGKLKGGDDVEVTIKLPGYNPSVTRTVNLLQLSNASIGSTMKDMAKELREQFK